MGTLVTTQNWELFWLNEEFTMFIERKITSKMAGGEQMRSFGALMGLAELKEDIKHISEQHPEYTCLSRSQLFGTLQK